MSRIMFVIGVVAVALSCGGPRVVPGPPPPPWGVRSCVQNNGFRIMITADPSGVYASVEGAGAKIELARGASTSPPMVFSNNYEEWTLRRQDAGHIRFECHERPNDYGCKGRHTETFPSPSLLVQSGFDAPLTTEELPPSGAYFLWGSWRHVLARLPDRNGFLQDTAWADLTWRVEYDWSAMRRVVQVGPLKDLELVVYDRNGLPEARDFGGSFRTGGGDLVLTQTGRRLTGKLDNVQVEGGVFGDTAFVHAAGDSTRYLVVRLSPDNQQIHGCGSLAWGGQLGERTSSPAPAATPSPSAAAAAPPMPPTPSRLKWVAWANDVPVDAIRSDAANGIAVCRATHQGAWHVGKLWRGTCYIAWGDLEYEFRQGFQVLVGLAHWGNEGPANMVIGGIETVGVNNGHPLGVCRAKHPSDGSIAAGKVLDGWCYYGWGGKAQATQDFEYLYPEP